MSPDFDQSAFWNCDGFETAGNADVTSMCQGSVSIQRSGGATFAPAWTETLKVIVL